MYAVALLPSAVEVKGISRAAAPTAVQVRVHVVFWGDVGGVGVGHEWVVLSCWWLSTLTAVQARAHVVKWICVCEVGVGLLWGMHCFNPAAPSCRGFDASAVQQHSQQYRWGVMQNVGWGVWSVSGGGVVLVVVVCPSFAAPR
jgi:hypothetical protein